MKVLLGVSGSIAAYKAPMIVRLLRERGVDVRVVMTPSATRFVGAATFSGLTGETPLVDVFDGAGEPHVTLAQWADLVVIAPATTDILARLAAGRAADAVTATVAAFTGPVLVAPAMHPTMWSNPRTQRNVHALLEDPAWQLIGPMHGEVASGDRGVGRMAEPEQIVSAAVATLSAKGPQSLAGRHLVVTAGPTEESLDPVRVLTNRSSGRMGFHIAERAAQRGARVSLVAGPVALPTPRGVDRTDVRTALDMKAALDALLQAPVAVDALVMCAAVSDFRPKHPSADKLHRTAEGSLVLELVPNPDIIAEIATKRTTARPHLTAFALETGDWDTTVELATKKLGAKGVDLVVANNASEALEGDATRVAFVNRAGHGPPLTLSKRDAAERLLNEILLALGPSDAERAP